MVKKNKISNNKKTFSNFKNKFIFTIMYFMLGLFILYLIYLVFVVAILFG